MDIIFFGHMKTWQEWVRSDLFIQMARLGHRLTYIGQVPAKKFWRYFFPPLRLPDSPGSVDYKPLYYIEKKYQVFDMSGWESSQLLKYVSMRQQNGPLVMMSNNIYAVNLFKEANRQVPVIYYVHDRFSEYGSRTAREKVHFDNTETQTFTKADGVLCASRALLEEAKQYTSRAHWFPNAVGEEVINRSLPQTRPNYRVGMVSYNLKRIDCSLIKAVAAAMPDVKIELVGINDLSDHISFPANVRLIPQIPFSRLGEVLSRWDAGLALYQRDRFNEYCCPLKYFEYSAFNLPTITTSIPEGKVFADLYPKIVFRADTCEEVINSLRYIWADESTDFTVLAKENTWTTRAKALTEILSSVLSAKDDSRIS